MRRGKTRTLGMNLDTNPYEVACLAVAPVFALASLALKKNWRVAAALVVAAITGWALLFAADRWVDSHWAVLLERTPNPSIEFLRQFNSDGASKSVTLLFGLPVSFLYALVCFATARLLRRVINRKIREP